jgi:hypothetical protein
MKTTNIFEKLFSSITNIAFTFVLSIPFLLIYGDTTKWKITWVGIFFLYNCIFEFVYNRCLGMMFSGTYYEKEKTGSQKIIYVSLYSISFSTILFYIWFPFDILILNLILIQLPFVLITGNTFHGFVSGKIKTIRKINL